LKNFLRLLGKLFWSKCHVYTSSNGWELFVLLFGSLIISEVQTCDFHQRLIKVPIRLQGLGACEILVGGRALHALAELHVPDLEYAEGGAWPPLPPPN